MYPLDPGLDYRACGSPQELYGIQKQHEQVHEYGGLQRKLTRSMIGGEKRNPKKRTIEIYLLGRDYDSNRIKSDVYNQKDSKSYQCYEFLHGTSFA